MPFVKGQSGNPKGPPPKHRALTTLLEAAGNVTVPCDADGKRHARKQLLARTIWQAATEGTTTLPNGETIQFGAEDILAAAKWIYTHIDGPPKGELELSGLVQTQIVTADDLAVARKRALEYEAATTQPPRERPT